MDDVDNLGLTILFECNVIYGHGSQFFLIDLIGEFFALLLAVFLFVMELKSKTTKQDTLKLFILLSFSFTTLINCLTSIIPFPFNYKSMIYVCSNANDITFYFGWILVEIWLANATLFPFIKSKRLKKLSQFGITSLILLSFFLYVISIVLLNALPSSFILGYEISYFLMDGLLLILPIFMIIKLATIIHSIPSRHPQFRVVLKRLKAFLFMLVIQLLIFIFILILDILTSVTTFFPFSRKDLYNCYYPTINCTKTMIKVAFISFAQGSLSIVVFLCTFTSFVVGSNASANKKTYPKKSKNRTISEKECLPLYQQNFERMESMNSLNSASSSGSLSSSLMSSRKL
ncbi:uncharacterized protein MONOS_18190 [Monocercomonoides exilis]|uniref:uncharacterized protein n=1 Tax=Monocercomonoides exilis TaxID=2049356 RepID=UPI0035598769|nr:hypothetical protein MONOS_18190 [Monocercomonoides exilis]